jgi:hypothetical protein
MILTKKSLVLVSSAALLGLISINNLWFIYFSTIVILCVILIKNKFEEKEANFLIKLFLLFLLLRISIVLIMWEFIIKHDNGVSLFGDGQSNHFLGYIISETLKSDLTKFSSQVALNNRLFQSLPFLYRLFRVPLGGEIWVLPSWIGRLPSVDAYQVTGYAYLSSIFYYFFGFKPIIGMFFNSLLGSLLCICVYSIIKRISDNSAPKVGAVLAGLFPSLFLWATINEKEIIIIFLNVLIILCWTIIVTRKKWFLFPVIILLTWIGRTFRSPFLLPFIFYNISIILMLTGLWVIRKRAVLLGFAFLTILLIFFSVKYPPQKLVRQVHQGVVKILDHHRVQVWEKGASYKILEEKYYDPNESLYALSYKQIIMAYCNGLGHFFFEPLPYKIDNFVKLLAYPGDIYISFLLIFFILGIIITFKKNPAMFIILFSNFFIFSSLIALGEGNMGGLFRHRDIVVPIFIIFASIGLTVFFKDQQKLSQSQF